MIKDFAADYYISSKNGHAALNALLEYLEALEELRWLDTGKMGRTLTRVEQALPHAAAVSYRQHEKLLTWFNKAPEGLSSQVAKLRQMLEQKSHI